VGDAGPYARFLRPALFALDAERAHDLARLALTATPLWRFLGPGPATDPRLATTVAGVRLPSPVGLAPGFDKDCDMLASLGQLGFGFLAPGSVMGGVRAGNRRPRLARIPVEEAVLNAMGLPSKGLEHAVRRLRRLRDRPVPIFVDVQGTTPEEIVANVLALQPYADALEVSLVCPNTPDTRANEGLEAVDRVARDLAARRERAVFVKIPVEVRFGPDDALRRFLDICRLHGLEGVVACGARRVRTDRLAVGAGQLGGRPVLEETLRLVRRVRAHAGGDLSIVASGGISTGDDAAAAMTAGAAAVEIYSAFVYRGPLAPALINAELLAALDVAGVEAVRDLRPGGPQPVGG
jgi:dihydroorotate dehydrogenase